MRQTFGLAMETKVQHNLSISAASSAGGRSTNGSVMQFLRRTKMSGNTKHNRRRGKFAEFRPKPRRAHVPKNARLRGNFLPMHRQG
jgi:hypothetical protein